MRRITSILLTSVLTVGMVVSLVGCGGSEDSKETEGETTAEETETVSEETTKVQTSQPEETETIEYFDPFEGVSVECSGADGDVSVELVFNDSYYDQSAYSITGQTEGLSDGDEVTVTVSDLVINQTEETDGLTPTQTTKTFPVTADSKYITNANDIPEEFIEEYKEYFLNKAYETGQEMEQDIEGFSFSAEYIGYKFVVNENPVSNSYSSNYKNYNSRYNNQLILYFDETDPFIDNYREGYCLINLTIDNSGTIAYEYENTEDPNEPLPDSYIVLADTVED